MIYTCSNHNPSEILLFEYLSDAPHTIHTHTLTRSLTLYIIIIIIIIIVIIVYSPWNILTFEICDHR